MDGSLAWELVRKEVELCMSDVPTEREALLPWLLAQPQDANVKLLAALVSVTVYRVRHNNVPEMAHLDRLAGLVGLDMAKWWTPTAQSYLGHVSKERIAAVVTEAVGAEQAQPILAMKKAQAATAAEQLLDGKGWVPELMRSQPLLSNPVATVEESDE